MRKKSAKEPVKRKKAANLGRVGGSGGGPREPFGGGQRSAGICPRVWHALPPRGRRIRMRLAARAPPPPILELGVRCSWLHSAACKFSIEIRAVPGGFGDLQILLQKTVWNVSKMMPKSVKLHPKSTKSSKRCQNRFQIHLKWCPGALGGDL